MSKDFSRREFLQTSLTAIMMGSVIVKCQRKNYFEMPTRPLGKTGEYVSIIGIGGWHIGNKLNTSESARIIHEAIENGVNFFDNCWDYNDGLSEKNMGEALSVNGYRSKIFLMSKVCGRDYKTAKSNLEDSLRRLKTDYLDLWQFHAIKWDDDPELIFDKENGAIKAALEAKREGKIRFIGFTGHKHPKYHLAMLEKDFGWDTIQFPTNILDYNYDSFQKNVLPIAQKRNIGIIGMKGLAAQKGIIVRELGISPKLARTYALSLPVSTLVCGINNRDDLLQDIEIARNFKPLTENDMKMIANEHKSISEHGKMEEYKTGNYGCDWYHNQFLNKG
jgi:predicted aldo/keto reductase-like oxidoreductase